MIRNSAHRGSLTHAAITSGQSKLHFLRAKNSIIKEHLIKITEAEEQQTIAVLFFECKVLLHHRCKISHFALHLPHYLSDNCSRTTG